MNNKHNNTDSIFFGVAFSIGGLIALIAPWQDSGLAFTEYATKYIAFVIIGAFFLILGVLALLTAIMDRPRYWKKDVLYLNSISYPLDRFINEYKKMNPDKTEEELDKEINTALVGGVDKRKYKFCDKKGREYYFSSNDDTELEINNYYEVTRYGMIIYEVIGKVDGEQHFDINKTYKKIEYWTNLYMPDMHFENDGSIIILYFFMALAFIPPIVNKELAINEFTVLGILAFSTIIYDFFYKRKMNRLLKARHDNENVKAQCIENEIASMENKTLRNMETARKVKNAILGTILLGIAIYFLSHGITIDSIVFSAFLIIGSIIVFSSNGK